MKIFKALRIINAPITRGRPIQFASMTNSFNLLQEQSRFNVLRSRYSIDIRSLKFPGSDITSAWYAINNEVRQAYIEGYMPIVMNGDHSQAVGSVSAAKETYLDTKLIWIDAHADIHSIHTSESKNIHGMPLSFLSLQIDNLNVPGVESFKCIDLYSDLAYMGVRSIDRAEEAYLNHYKIPHIQSISNPENRSLWISFDVDALDPSQFTCTETKEDRGLHKVQVIEAFRTALDHLVGCDITEIDTNAGAEDSHITDLDFICDLLELIADHTEKRFAANILQDDEHTP